MLDADMNVILLEINRSPDPSFNTAYQREMFYDLARDSLSGTVTKNRLVVTIVLIKLCYNITNLKQLFMTFSSYSRCSEKS